MGCQGIPRSLRSRPLALSEGGILLNPLVFPLGHQGGGKGGAPPSQSARGTRRAKRDAGGCPATPSTQKAQQLPPSFASFKNHSHHGSKTGMDSGFRRNDVGCARNDMSTHPILKSFPILQILVHPAPLDSGFRRNDVRDARNDERHPSKTPLCSPLGIKREGGDHSHHSKIIRIMVQKAKK